jgi:hypothetical protein
MVVSPVGPAPRTDLSNVRRPVSGRQDVADEQRLLVVNTVGDLRAAHVGGRHAAVFRLSSVDAAAKFPTALDAVVDISPAAKIAFPAKTFHIDRNAVSDGNLLYAGTDFGDLADELMAEHNACFRARYAAISDVQVARANRRARHFDNRVPRLQYLRHGYVG